MITSKVPHICYGGDYNPEQWPEDVWPDDVRLMREAGVNFVTVGVFSWARIEPRPGEYDFAWLDRLLDLLAAAGIAVDLATATASPPPWLARLHPDSLPVTEDDTTLWPGARQQYCPSSAAYREAASRLVRALATRYKDHPALALWHIGNEYGCHVSACYCEASATAFRDWLRNRYTTLDALNDAWGTAFWSQHYADWDEIYPPRRAPTFANPTQQLDFRRFSSDALLECFEMERAILREITPTLPVTTNFMGFFKPVNYWKWAEREDVICDDAYPDPSDPDAPMDAAMRFDLMRSLAAGKPWLLMEQTPSQVNWRPYNVLKRPGQMRLWCYSALARGADGLMFFQWRAARAGAEKFHGAFVPHVGTERSRVWDEMRSLGAELPRLDALLGGHTPATVAILLDWESWWALELDSHPSASIWQVAQLRDFYRPLYAANIAVDFARPDADLSQYRTVLVPNLYMARDGVGSNLERFVAGGGTLVMSFFSGIADKNDHILLGGYPAPFRKLLGLRVEEFDPYVPGQFNSIRDRDGQSWGCDLWSDLLNLEGAEALATYERDFYAGRPAVTRHTFSQGTAYYLGTRPDPAYLARLLLDVCAAPALPIASGVGPGIEIIRRVTDTGAYWFVLNQNPHPVELSLRRPLTDILSTDQHEGSLSLPAYGVAVLGDTASG